MCTSRHSCICPHIVYTIKQCAFFGLFQKFLSNEAKAILSLYPSDRTDEQVKLALLALNQTVDAFGEFPIKLQKSLASVGWYEK